MIGPIGVFDSGLGGLTVLSQLLKHLPGEEYIYFGDNARVPYGTKSEKMILHFSEQAVNFLLSKGANFIVVACNTSSAIALQHLKSKFPDIGFIGMIEPAVSGAVETSKNKNIGVIGTEATINSNAYQRSLNKFHPNNIYTKACPLFVPFVESGITSHGALDLMIEEYLSELKDKMDTLILGCTHYPYLKESIQKYLPDVNIIDTGEQAAIELNNNNSDQKGISKIDYYLSDKPNNFINIANDKLNLKINNLEQIDIESF